VFASGHTDKLIAIYIYQPDTHEFKKMHILQGHDNWVRDLAFATFTATDENTINNSFQDGDLMLASASQDKYIRLWKISAHLPPVVQQEQKQDTAELDDLSKALLSSSL
jgi:elongator complex protein 2